MTAKIVALLVKFNSKQILFTVAMQPIRKRNWILFSNKSDLFKIQKWETISTAYGGEYICR